jgi:hypothetical protein
MFSMTCKNVFSVWPEFLPHTQTQGLNLMPKEGPKSAQGTPTIKIRDEGNIYNKESAEGKKPKLKPNHEIKIK